MVFQSPQVRPDGMAVAFLVWNLAGELEVTCAYGRYPVVRVLDLAGDVEKVPLSAVVDKLRINDDVTLGRLIYARHHIV